MSFRFAKPSGYSFISTLKMFTLDPNIWFECRVQGGGAKVMAWVGLIQGSSIVHWLTATNQLMEKVTSPCCKLLCGLRLSIASRKQQYWFHQDGATVHTTTQVKDWLKEKLNNRVISRFMDHHWPSRSPSLSPLDYTFWGAAMQEVRIGCGRVCWRA